MRERRSQYHGPVEIFVGGEKRLVANASLAAYVDVVVIKTIGATTFMDGNTSWDGYIVGASRQSLLPLFGERMLIRFPDGREAGAILEGIDSGQLQGFGAVPF
jgi:hypothetical protein